MSTSIICLNSDLNAFIFLYRGVTESEGCEAVIVILAVFFFWMEDIGIF